MIALLYMRISKFDKTEQRQQQVMKEMEDSLALYISDVKEENDRLIDQLTKINKQRSNSQEDELKPQHTGVPKESTGAPSSYFQGKPPVSKVMNSYKMQQQIKTFEEPKVSKVDVEETEFEKVYRLSKEGFSTNEIASRLGKGKTEVELILKFK